METRPTTRLQSPIFLLITRYSLLAPYAILFTSPNIQSHTHYPYGVLTLSLLKPLAKTYMDEDFHAYKSMGNILLQYFIVLKTHY